MLILGVLKRVLFISCFLVLSATAFSQGNTTFSVNRDSLKSQRENRLLKDTVESVYGPLTTRYTYEKNFKFNNLVFNYPDTIPDNLHRYTDIERNGNLGQNLGNLGTAYRGLYYEPSMTIGRRSGYNAYDEFYVGPDDIKYFDTKSPFTEINVVYGGGRRGQTDIVFALNDSVYLNLGFQYKSVRAEKQLAFLSTGDFQSKGTNYNFFGFIRPKKLPRYLALFNFTQMKFSVDEQGGILDPAIDPANDEDGAEATYFKYRDANVLLDDAESYDKRGGVHIFQQYNLDSVLQVYHSGTYYNQIVRYTDEYNLAGSDSLIYKPVGRNLVIDSILDRTTYNELSNEFGVKGYTKSFSYTVFYRSRYLKYDNRILGGEGADLESYLGGTLRQKITPKIFLKASGEYLIGGGFFVEGDFTSSFFDARVSKVSSQPSYLSELYAGQQGYWINGFKNEQSENLYGEVKINTQGMSFRPLIRFNRIANYLYYDQDKRPNQAVSDIVILAPGFHFDFNLSPKWKWSSSFYYNTVSGGSSDLYRLPDMLANGQLAYKNVVFNGKMIVHTGIDLHYRSAYYANAYNPIVQQYYLQNDFENDAFIKADLFLNFKVENFHFFVKSAHINQGITSDGYFLTPYYTGVKRTLDMGVRWSFYN
ncbi:putative beta-barrel porin [Roseivirga ehrenbergii]|uniref:Porin n=1 Tax=Roseivirga ehrenbergii (strain DSM 102268 / JCM 13514 / KCTC 12282 / NCIMB 14502 / KMM 6017) TaxID=279360 RepID=A0A150X7J3_ROSEK|nr:hypothetical protein MB14_05710 [Roseivirga ehrenbergii]TCL13976.1 putative beta-barrel porin [Roseivirga ehrenbergii]